MRAPWIAAWVSFVVLALGVSPAHFWLDAGEIGAAGFDLGVAHPPGAPGLLLLFRAAGLLPLGTLGFRMALVDAALGAATVGLVVAVLQRRGAAPVLALIGGAWVVTGLTFVRQARVVEVYALAAALLMVSLWGLDPRVKGALRTGRRLLAVAAATWAAWCFGDLRLALGPLLLVRWVAALRGSEPWARWAPVTAAMASLVIVALPLASVGEPTVDWGDPQTLPALVDHLGARSIRESFADQILPASWPMWGLNAQGAMGRLAEDLGAPGLTVAVICVGLAWRRDPVEPASTTRATALALTWLVVVECFYVVGINPMGGADRQTGLVLAPLAALVVGDVARRWLADRGRLSWAVLPLLGTVLLLPPTLHSRSDLAVTRSWAPHGWTRAALAQLPPRSLLLTQSDDLAAGTVWAAVVEGARPDVISIPAQHLYRPTPAGIDPERAAIWDAAHAGRTEAERIIAAIAAHPGPVALELPGAGLFARVPWTSAHGRLPLGIGGSATVLASLPRTDVASEVEGWLPRLPTEHDRRRLAIAVANWARARVRRGASGLAATGEARAALELSLARVDTQHPSALVTLAALRDRMGDRAGAIALTRRALELDPGRPAALTNLALYLSRDRATLDEARALAERAVALRPWRASGWLRLAAVREVAGDQAGAAAARAHAQALE
ncbi:MAG: DUF2723 domain-containing protein [Myxococcota bacterium]